MTYISFSEGEKTRLVFSLLPNGIRGSGRRRTSSKRGFLLSDSKAGFPLLLLLPAASPSHLTSFPPFTDLEIAKGGGKNLR